MRDTLAPTDVIISEDGARALTYNWGLRRNVQLWDTATGLKRGQFNGGNQDRLALSPDGTRVLIGTAYQHTARLLDSNDGKELKRFQGSADWI